MNQIIDRGTISAFYNAGKAAELEKNTRAAQPNTLNLTHAIEVPRTWETRFVTTEVQSTFTEALGLSLRFE